MNDDSMKAAHGHPRPDFCRERWMSLNGIWEFDFGKKENLLIMHKLYRFLLCIKVRQEE